MRPTIDGEARQENDANIMGTAPAERRGSQISAIAAGRDGVIAHHHVIPSGDIGCRVEGALILPG